MYKVIERFRDLTDGHLYEAGDSYPYDGRQIPAVRIHALESGQNGACKALIERVDNLPTPAPETPKKVPRGRKKAQ